MERFFGINLPDQDDRFASPPRAHLGPDRHYVNDDPTDFNEQNRSVPSAATFRWRQISGIFVLSSCTIFVLWLNNFSWSGGAFRRRGQSGNPTHTPTDPDNNPSIPGSSLTDFNLTFKTPEILTADQLQELQTYVVKYIDEKVRGDTTGWSVQHQDLIGKQAELNELRKTYQALRKNIQNLLARKQQERQEKDLTVYKDLVQFVHNRRKNEEFLNETIGQEVRRLFEEVANPQTSMDRARAVRMWLINTFVSPGDYDTQMKYWQRNLRRELEKLVLDSITSSRATEIALSVYEQFRADQTGLFDYALKTTGASVVSIRDTTPAEVPQLVTNVFGVSQEVLLPLSPELVIQPGFLPGECWPFTGFPGTLVIRLAGPTRISSFAVDYMPRKMSPTGKLLPAPRMFEVYGLNTVWDHEPFLFGSYEYDMMEHIQIFPVQNHPPNNQDFRFVELKVLSNHGSPIYTSICRFRVHGNVTDDTAHCNSGS